MSKSQAKEFLHNEIFCLDEFARHVKEVSFNTHIHEDIVREVLQSYFTNIFIVINTVRKIKTKINIYGFCSLEIREGKRNKKLKL